MQNQYQISKIKLSCEQSASCNFITSNKVSFTPPPFHTHKASHSLNHYKFYQLESPVKTTESFNQFALAKVTRTNSCLVISQSLINEIAETAYLIYQPIKLPSNKTRPPRYQINTPNFCVFDDFTSPQYGDRKQASFSLQSYNEPDPNFYQFRIVSQTRTHLYHIFLLLQITLN